VFHIPAGPEDWKLRPEFPTGAEIRVPQIEAEPLPQNRIAGGWTSKNDYLETHYRLLRREGTEALRYAVNKYKSSITASDDEDLCIYSKVSGLLV
jgi:helicase required for RNAi-mediated heterochromatin assembly 1